MLTPRDLEVLDVIGEVMQQRLTELRREHEDELTDLRAKVAALEARPMALRAFPDDIKEVIGPLTSRVAELETRPVPPPVDVTPLADKIAALEARPVPEVSSEMLLALGREFRETLEQRVLDVEEKRLDALTATTDALTRVETRTQEGFAELGQQIGEEVERRTSLGKWCDAMQERMATLEAKPEPPPTLDVPTINFTIQQEVSKATELQIGEFRNKSRTIIEEAMARIPEPQRGEPGPPGEPGKDGTSVDVEAVRQMIHEDLTAQIAALPPPQKGEPGEPGKDGTSVDVEVVRQMIQEDLGKSAGTLYAQLDHALTTKIAALPLPEKGDPGDPGAPGEPGKDGTSVTVEDFRDMFEAAYARFELETERRIMDTVQRTLDRIPVPRNGEDGKDGLGFDDLEVVQVGERSVEMRFTRGEQLKVFTFDFPWLIDRGVWKAGTTYERGDGVTWAGSFWIAQRADSGKPGEGDGWRLAVKRGRDGKNGDRGLKGDPGPPGKNGRDLNHRLGGGLT